VKNEKNKKRKKTKKYLEDKTRQKKKLQGRDLEEGISLVEIRNMRRLGKEKG